MLTNCSILVLLFWFTGGECTGRARGRGRAWTKW